MSVGRSIKKWVMWLLHTASWVLALYLFATGELWGGVGCALVSILQFLVLTFIAALVWHTPEYQEGVLEAKKAAREAGKAA